MKIDLAKGGWVVYSSKGRALNEPMPYVDCVKLKQEKEYFKSLKKV